MLSKSAICSAVALVIASVAAVEGLAQVAPNIMRIPIGPPGNNSVIELRYIPAGSISKKQPSASDDSSQGSGSGLAGLLASSNKIEVVPFYISINEITFAQLRAVLEPEAIDRIQKRIEATAGKDETTQYLREAMKSSDMPAFAVSFAEAIEFCKKVTSAAQAADAAGNQMSIETKRFRIPAHYEWQFACRANADPAAVKKFPHFNRWVDRDALEAQFREMTTEEWGKLGRNEAELTGSQFQIFELLDARMGAADALGMPLKIQSAYLKAALGIDRNFLVAGTLHPVRNTSPNNWGLNDMHGNVCEWTIKLDSREQVLKLWESVVDAEQRETIGSSSCLILAGGGFAQIASDKGAWKSFAIWGGYPIDKTSGELKPYQVSEGLDNTDRGVAADSYPGLRIVMDRIIRNDWFFAIRKMGMVDDAEIDLEPVLKGSRQSVNELATSNDAKRIIGLMNAYQALAMYRSGKTDEARMTFSKAAANLAQLEEKKADSGLAALLAAGGGADNQPNEPTDDEVFFSVAAQYFK